MTHKSTIYTEKEDTNACSAWEWSTHVDASELPVIQKEDDYE